MSIEIKAADVSRAIQTLFEAREIKDAGCEIGAWNDHCPLHHWNMTMGPKQ